MNIANDPRMQDSAESRSFRFVSLGKNFTTFLKVVLFAFTKAIFQWTESSTFKTKKASSIVLPSLVGARCSLPRSKTLFPLVLKTPFDLFFRNKDNKNFSKKKRSSSLKIVFSINMRFIETFIELIKISKMTFL